MALDGVGYLDGSTNPGEADHIELAPLGDHFALGNLAQRHEKDDAIKADVALSSPTSWRYAAGGRIVIDISKLLFCGRAPRADGIIAGCTTSGYSRSSTLAEARCPGSRRWLVLRPTGPNACDGEGCPAEGTHQGHGPLEVSERPRDWPRGVCTSSIVGEGRGEHTQDLAVTEMDEGKIDMATFRGNVVDLGSKFGGARPVELLFPNPRQAYPKTFRCPKERLFRLRGIIPDEDMSHPTGTDEHGDNCLFVMKKGRSTGLTVGTLWAA